MDERVQLFLNVAAWLWPATILASGWFGYALGYSRGERAEHDRWIPCEHEGAE